MQRNWSSWCFAVCLALAGVSLAYGESVDCSGNGPLIVGPGASVGSSHLPAKIGEWRLPVSSESPGEATAAVVRVDLINSPGRQGALVQLSFSFPDSNPWGLPFSFEGAELSWESGGAHFSAALDWTDHCSGPGVSMFPHQSWSATMDVDSSALKGGMIRPVFKVWGSRN